MRTKLFALLLAIVASSCVAFADKTYIGDLYYNLNTTNRTATVIHPDYGGSQYEGADYYKGLTSANIPASVQYNGIDYKVLSIGERAFEGCEDLISVVIPNGLETIEENAFSLCDGLTSITVPESLKSMAQHAFFMCHNLNSVEWNAIECEDMYCCSPWFFMPGTAPITSFSFGEKVAHIPAHLCQQLETLISVEIPNSVTSIGESAFEDCTNLVAIYNHGITPAEVYSALFGTAFDGVDKSTCKLYVPSASISLYQNAPVWRDFYNIEAIEDAMAIDEVEVDGSHGQKVIRNGQVLIERGNKTYTLQGAEVQ